KLVEGAIELITKAGATVVDPADIPTSSKLGPAELVVLLFELKAGLNNYLAERALKDGPRTLAEVIKFNETNSGTEMPYFGQELFLQAEEKGPLTTKAYLDAFVKNHKLARDQGIDAIARKFKLDAIIAPSRVPASLAELVHGDAASLGCSTLTAVACYPHITPPVCSVHRLPVGITLVRIAP